MNQPCSVLLLAFAVVCAALMPGCGDSPPSSQLRAAVEKEVRRARPDLLDAAGSSVQVVDVKIRDLKRVKSETRANAGYPVYSADWTATLRFKEPHAWVVAAVDGTHVVRTVAKVGDSLEYAGSLSTRMDEDDREWRITAWNKAEPWSKLWSQIAGSDGAAPVFGYPTVRGTTRGTAPRGTNFRPHSALKPLVEEGSDEMKTLLAVAEERAREAREAEAARQQVLREQRELEQQQRQEQLAEERRKQQEEADERRRLAQEQAAEARRVAEEQARARAEAQRRDRLLPMVQPLGSPHGAVVTTDAGLAMGTVILNAKLDDQSFAATGTAVDLRQMPFHEADFEAEVSDRAVLTIRSSLAAEPLQFSRAGPSGLSGSGVALSTLSPSEREQLDALIALGRRLQGASPLELAVEVYDGDAAKPLEMELLTAPLAGLVHYRGRIAPTVAPMFSTQPAPRGYAWKQETVALRLAEPVRGKGLIVKGGRRSTDNLLVVVNGVHRARIAAIPAGGAAVITLPPDLDVLDIRLEAVGAATARGVQLITQ